METSDVLEKFTSLRKDSQAAEKLLRQLASLDSDRGSNLPKIKREIGKLEPILRRVGEFQRDEIQRWFEKYREDIPATEQTLRDKFGASLAAELETSGLALRGQYPELQAGLFTIEVDFPGASATIWYGPKKEELLKCRLSAREISNKLQELRDNIGRRLPADEFFRKLRQAYLRAGGDNSRPAPIIDVLAEFSFILQTSRFRKDPRQEHYSSYRRADFSYDLFLLRDHLASAHGRLTVATRAHTTSAHDFLWIPDDETGSGSTYSHMHFEDAR